MSMRSASNPRTQNREYAGATRKGASSAKPARAAASSVRVVPASAKARRKQAERGESLEGLSKEEKRERKREARAREDRMYDASNVMLKADEDYKKLRRVFWVILGLGVVFIVLTWVSLMLTQAEQAGTTSVLQIVLVVLSYIAIIGAFVFDLVKIRPIRNYYRSVAEGMSEKKIVELLETAAAEKDGKDSSSAKGAAKGSGSPGTTVEPVKKKPKKNQRSRH